MTLNKALGRVLTRCGNKKMTTSAIYNIIKEEIDKLELKGPDKSLAVKFLKRCSNSTDTTQLLLDISEKMFELSGMGSEE